MKTVLCILEIIFELLYSILSWIECGTIVVSFIVFIFNTFLGGCIQNADQIYLFTLIIVLINIFTSIIDFYIVKNH